MIGLDTSVLVRYLTQDDPEQAARATRIVEQELSNSAPGFIGLMVLVETARMPVERAAPEPSRRALLRAVHASAPSSAFSRHEPG